jgi:hypothetical protein
MSIPVGRMNSPSPDPCLTDGGDARCMSELHILQEFMHRLEPQTGGKTQRPCDYFDLIVAVDAAGYVG